VAVSTLKRLRGSSGGTFASLHGHRNYRLYFAGQIVSYCGSVMQDTALPWLVYERTHSPFLVGLLVFCRYGPFSLLGPQGGVLADRHDNRRILVATQTSAMAVASLLTVVAFVGAAPLWTIFALACGSGVILAFDTPSKYSLIYQLVSRDELPNAVALSYTLQNTARIIGPAIGGVLIAGFGAGWCFLINAASFVATLIALLLIATRRVLRDCAQRRPLVGVRRVAPGSELRSPISLHPHADGSCGRWRAVWIQRDAHAPSSAGRADAPRRSARVWRHLRLLRPRRGRREPRERNVRWSLVAPGDHERGHLQYCDPLAGAGPLDDRRGNHPCRHRGRLDDVGRRRRRRAFSLRRRTGCADD